MSQAAAPDVDGAAPPLAKAGFGPDRVGLPGAGAVGCSPPVNPAPRPSP